MESEKRLIDANRVINEMRMVLNENPDQKDTVTYHAFSLIIDYLKKEPTVDAVEVVHGMWVSSGCGFDCCSKCRMVYADGYLTAMGIKPRTQFNYCPNCGAKMDGDGNG